MAIIRKDQHGLYIRGRFYSASSADLPYRPGTFSSYSHALNTSEGGLKEGDHVKSNHVHGSPLVRIKLLDGTVLHWGSYGRSEGDFPESKL